MSTVLRPAYRNGKFIGFALHQHNAHSNCLQPVTPAMRYTRLINEMGEYGLTDPAGIDEYVRTGKGPLAPRLDAIDQTMQRRKLCPRNQQD